MIPVVVVVLKYYYHSWTEVVDSEHGSNFCAFRGPPGVFPCRHIPRTTRTVTLVAMILAQDAYFYWTHRAMHHPRLFRTFHWTHHKSKTPTPWSAYAFDIPEAIVVVAFVPIWVALVPMHDLAIFSFVTWQIVRNVIGHAGVEMHPVSGRPSRLFGWWNTSTHHDLHHQHLPYEDLIVHNEGLNLLVILLR